MHMIVFGVDMCDSSSVVFSFKQMTPSELRISAWSPDVCSADLFERPASSKVDIAAKEGAKGDLGARVDALKRDGRLSTGFHWPFFRNADATDPAVAGIWGALKGSLLTILIAFLIAFPTGVLAALYLEEYAPRNRWTDLIEVSINNLRSEEQTSELQS